MKEVSLQDVLNYLLFMATKNGIAVQMNDDLSDSMPDFSIAKLQAIVINLNYNTSISVVFRLAHELAHLLFGDNDSQRLYSFSPLCKSSEERIAHQEGMRMIAKFVYQDVDIEYRNYIDFMNALGLPSRFERMAYDEVKSA